MMPTRTNIQPGDLVARKYHIRGTHPMGVIIERDRNGFLDVLWGSRVEHMWDDYDLTRIDELEEDREKLQGR
jgi:hypothetical protein